MAEKPTIGGTQIMRAFEKLKPAERTAVFWLGFLLTAAPPLGLLWVEVVRGHEETVFGTAVEISGTVVLMVLGICLMIPALGVYLINHIPLPSFLRRK